MPLTSILPSLFIAASFFAVLASTVPFIFTFASSTMLIIPLLPRVTVALSTTDEPSFMSTELLSTVLSPPKNSFRTSVLPAVCVKFPRKPLLLSFKTSVFAPVLLITPVSEPVIVLTDTLFVSPVILTVPSVLISLSTFSPSAPVVFPVKVILPVVVSRAITLSAAFAIAPPFPVAVLPLKVVLPEIVTVDLSSL